jgi:hypothetical protein
MGLSDRDYMYEKRSSKTTVGGRRGGGSGNDPDWKTIGLWLSVVTNGVLLFVLFRFCG